MPILHHHGATIHQMHGATFTALASPTRGSRENSVWTVSIAPGTPATPHQVTREEIFFITAGHADVTLGEDQRDAAPGDCIVVPPETRFALRVVGDAPLEAVVCFPVGGQARLADGTTFVPPWAE